jgi:hypothetical protein
VRRATAQRCFARSFGLWGRASRRMRLSTRTLLGPRTFASLCAPCGRSTPRRSPQLFDTFEGALAVAARDGGRRVVVAEARGDAGAERRLVFAVGTLGAEGGFVCGAGCDVQDRAAATGESALARADVRRRSGVDATSALFVARARARIVARRGASRARRSAPRRAHLFPRRARSPAATEESERQNRETQTPRPCVHRLVCRGPAGPVHTVIA